MCTSMTGADIEKAVKIADNAKTQRYGTCNTMETLLVAADIAPRVLPRLAKIYQDKGVELRGDDASRALVPQMNARHRGRLVRRIPRAHPRGAHCCRRR
jgi:gamma-glutamyl phosphate reductase